MKTLDIDMSMLSPPDIVLGQNSVGEVRYWHPTDAADGLVVVARTGKNGAESHPSLLSIVVPDFVLRCEVEDTRVIAEATGAHVGHVALEAGISGVGVTLPVPERVVEDAAAWPQRILGAKIFNGGQFPSTLAMKNLRDGAATISNAPLFYAHDLLAHYLTAWRLVPPEAMPHFAAQVDHVLNQNDQAARGRGRKTPAERFMYELESEVSIYGFGSLVNYAMMADAFGNDIYYWPQAAQTLETLFFDPKPTPRILPDEVKAHCTTLAAISRRLLTPESGEA